MQSDQSRRLFAAAQKYIPGGVNSPVRAFKSVGGTPIFFKEASGAYMTSVDGDSYLDFVGSWGPLLMGHAHPDVIAAVQASALKGLSFGAPCEDEIVLAQMVCERMPAMEMIRMVNSGTEAVMSALRLAKAVTNRDKVIKFAGCYHGHSDSFLVAAGSGALTFGVPSSPGVSQAVAKDTLVAAFNSLDSVEQLFLAYPNAIACIVIEPIAGNMGLVLPKPGFLEGLRALCDKNGALLVFDEVMTGFRVARGGAQELLKVTPDLTTLGKIIGGGMPVGAFGGRADLMKKMAPSGPVYQAGTLSGNPIAMAAGIATLKLLEKKSIYEKLAENTAIFQASIQQAAEAASIPVVVNAVCGMLSIFFTQEKEVSNFSQVCGCDTDRFSQLFHYLLKKGYYFAPSAFETLFISVVHTREALLKTAESIACFLRGISQ
jgi:glutamate-1-semialdehyde 2,1-aminomutase